MDIKNKTALIIDCANIGWQSSYAYSYMHHNDKPVGVLYGFLNNILNITDIYYPNYILFAWDSKKSRRKLIYPDYKKDNVVDISEEKMIMEQVTHYQLDLLRYEVLPSIGFKNHFHRTGFEADDVMASLVLQYDFELSVILSSDNDLYQCITDKIYVYNKNNGLVTPDTFYDTHGIFPDMWAKVKSLAGCSADKVPGVKGIKEKRAIQYLLGELARNSVAYKNILRAIGTAEFARDAKLVTLPLEQLEFSIHNDKIDMKNFINTCMEYGLNKLIRNSEKNKWKMLFNNINS